MADVLHIGRGGSPVDDAGEVEVLDAAEHLVEEVRHPLMVQVHVDHLLFYILSVFVQERVKV